MKVKKVKTVKTVKDLSVLQLRGDAHALLPEINASFARGLTIQAWVHLDSLEGDAPIIALGDRPDRQAITVTVEAKTGDLTFEVTERPGATRRVVARAAVAARRWVHVTVVQSERGSAEIYVDGALKTRIEGAPLPSAGSRAQGFLGRDLADRRKTLRGQLSEVRLWSRDLSADEIAASLGRRLSGDEPELVAYWPLDRLIGDRLADRSGRGRSARPVGGELVPAAGLDLAEEAPPSPAIALRDGDSIVAANTITRRSDALTFQAWVRLRGFASGSKLFELGGGGGSLSLVTDGGGKPLVIINAAGRPSDAVGGREALPLNRWTHVTVTVDEGEIGLYLDGVRVAAGARRPLAPFAPRAGLVGFSWKSLTIGGGAKAQALDADVAEIRLFTAVLTPRQIARSVGRTMLGTEANLAICWRLDEGRGTTARNAGLLGNDAGVGESGACDGVIKGGAWIRESGLDRARPLDARPTRALRLDGRRGYASAPGFPRGFSEGYTIEGWVHHAAFTGAPIVEIADVRDNRGASTRVEALRGSAHDRITLQGRDGSADLQLVVSRGPASAKALRILCAPKVLRTGAWIHVAATVHPSGLGVLCVDGQKVAEQVLFSPREVAADRGIARGLIAFGRSLADKTKHLDGSLAEVRIWGRALSIAEIRDRRFLRAAGGERGLLRCYHLDELEGDEILDAAPSGSSGMIAAGVARLEHVELPLWPNDPRVGAGVDASSVLMRDPQVRSKGTIVEVPTYAVTLSARTSEGAAESGAELEIGADEPVTIRIDQGDGVEHRLTPGKAAKVKASPTGKVRLTIDARGILHGGKAALRCPPLKVRSASMPAGQWEIICPDAQVQEALAGITGEHLRGGSPAMLGRRPTPSPLGRSVSEEAAEELAATVRALMGAAARSTIEAEDASPLSFGGDDEAPVGAARPIGRALSLGTAARIDDEAVALRRVIAPRVLAVPAGEAVSFAAGDEESGLEVALLSAPHLALASEPAGDDDDDEDDDADAEQDVAPDDDEAAALGDDAGDEALAFGLFTPDPKKQKERQERIAQQKAKREAERRAREQQRKERQAARQEKQEQRKAAIKKKRTENAQKLKRDLERIQASLAGVIEDAGEGIEALARDVAAKADELGRELGELTKSAILEPADKFLREVGDDLEDAIVIAVRTVDPKGVLVETIQVVVGVGERLIRTIVDSVETAVAVMGSFFAQVAAKIEDVINFIATVFDWGDILETADGLLALQKAALARWPASVRALRGRWNGVMHSVESKITGSFDRAIEALGVAEAPTSAEPDERTDLLTSKLDANLLRFNFAPKLDLSKIDLSIVDRIGKALDLKGIGRELREGFASMDLAELLSSPEAFFAGGGSAALLGLRALLQVLLRTVRVGGALFLEFVEQIFGLLETIANTRLEIPGLTTFIEATILGGRELTILTLLSVFAAIPYTVAHKLATGSAEGPFSGALSFAGDDGEADDPEAALAALEAGDEAKAAKAGGGWPKNAFAFVNVSATFLSGLITSICDFADDQTRAPRTLKLVNCIVGACVCGVFGLPIGEEGAVAVMEVGNWILGVLGAVVAGIDGVNGLIIALRIEKAKDVADNESWGDVLRYISVGVASLQLAWGAAAGIVKMAVAKSAEKRGSEALAMSSAIFAALVGILPVVEDSSAKIKAIKLGVASGGLVLQLGTGLGAAGWTVHLDAAGDAA